MFVKSTVVLLLLVIFLMNYLVTAVFHHNTINKHISLKYTNIIQTEKNNVVMSRNNLSDYFIPKKYGPFFMTIPLDHFKNGIGATFQNKYWVNSDYYKAKGPIILYNVGEAAADPSAYLVTNSAMAQLAEYLNGIVVIMEHRFYGTSGPKVKTFFDNTKEDLQTFNSKQALADMAYLIKHIKFYLINVPPVPKTKAVVYGCSYSGALAAWAREKYPELFFASISSSAPVEAAINFYQYFDPIIRYGPKPCISAIENVISYVDGILFNGTNLEVKKLKKMFHAEKFNDESFAQLLIGDMSGQWQYGINSTYNGFEEQICSYFPRTSNNNISMIKKNLSSYVNYINNLTRSMYCDGDEGKALEDCLFQSNFTVTNNVSGVSNNVAAWSWQTCLEFGFYQVSAPQNLPTIVSRKYGLSYYTDMCQNFFGKYGVPKWPDVDGTNKEFQGWDIQINRTIWIDGEWDSWRELSVNNINLHRNFGSNDQSMSIIIPKSTHCANVQRITDNSSKYLKGTFMQQYNTLKIWLATVNY